MRTRTWSVQMEANAFADDLFNGTYEECLEYCSRSGYDIDGENCRLAEIELDENGVVEDTIQISEGIQKKYFVIDERKKGDSFGGENGIMNKDDALMEAKNQWNALTLKEKENVEYFALMLAYEDEDGCILMDTAEEVWTPDK